MKEYIVIAKMKGIRGKTVLDRIVPWKGILGAVSEGFHKGADKIEISEVE